MSEAHVKEDKVLQGRVLDYSSVHGYSHFLNLLKFSVIVTFLKKTYSGLSSYISAGSSDKQKEADEKHRALNSSLNDFATLLGVFQSCKSR